MLRSRLAAVCLLLALMLAGIGGFVRQHLPVRAASVLTVNTNSDVAPPCKASALSLRCAIAKANADGSGDTIVFNIPASNCFNSLCMIGLSQSLPALTASHTTINGYTQSGAHPNSNSLSSGDNAVLAIHITNPTLRQGFDALDISGSNNTIEGLDFTGFLINLSTVAGGNAIYLQSGPTITPSRATSLGWEPMAIR